MNFGGGRLGEGFERVVDGEGDGEGLIQSHIKCSSRTCRLYAMKMPSLRLNKQPITIASKSTMAVP